MIIFGQKKSFVGYSVKNNKLETLSKVSSTGVDETSILYSPDTSANWAGFAMAASTFTPEEVRAARKLTPNSQVPRESTAETRDMTNV